MDPVSPTDLHLHLPHHYNRNDVFTRYFVDLLWVEKAAGTKNQAEKKNKQMKCDVSATTLLILYQQIAPPTLRISDLRLQCCFSFLVFNLFLRILACKYSTLFSAAVEKNCSQTSSLTWDILPASRVMVSRMRRMAARGHMESLSSSLGLGRHSLSNKVTE